MARLNFDNLSPALEFIYQNFQNTRFTFSDIPSNLKFTGLATGLQSKGLIIRVGIIPSHHRRIIWKLTPKGIRFAGKHSPTCSFEQEMLKELFSLVAGKGESD